MSTNTRRKATLEDFLGTGIKNPEKNKYEGRKSLGIQKNQVEYGHKKFIKP